MSITVSKQRTLVELESAHKQFIENLDVKLVELINNSGISFAELEYTVQIGWEAGSIVEITTGEKPDNTEKIVEISLDSFLDRSIGTLRTPFDLSSNQEAAAQRLADWLCLTTYAFRNEICSRQISDIVNGPLNEEIIGKSSYNRLANHFNDMLGTSGFVIWHVCKETKVDGEYELFEVSEDATEIPETLFLRALGSSHPQDGVDMPIDEGIASFVLTDGNTIRVDDLLDDKLVARLTDGRSIKHKPVVLDRGWLSGVFLPLRSQHRVVGVIGAYSPRRSGFNNLDENIVTRCAEQIAAYFVVHRARQRNSTLVQKVTELGKEIAAAQYSVFGSVHDAINASLAIRNNFDFIVPTTPTKQFFDAAKDHSERLKEVLGRLRSDVRNPRDIPLKISRVNLSEFTLERLNALSVDAHSKGIDLRIRIPSDIDVFLDEFRLSQILFNIVSNSIRHFNFTTRTPKEIRVTASDRSDKCVVTFHDNGPGIDPAYLPDRIFEPFVTTSDGMGLGLTIVKNFVDELDGTVTVRSEWGKWTEFTLVLPKRGKR